MLGLLGKKIAVQPLSDPDTTSSGLLYIPETAKEREDQGIVKYVGPEVETLKPGDYVLFSGYTGTQLLVENEMVIIMPEDAVQAIVIDPELPNTTIPGLFFQSKDGYFPANYEQIFYLIARAIKDTQAFQSRFLGKMRESAQETLTRARKET